ncbi:MAG: NAD-dependent protein deacylase [Polyangiaceae bacterium]|nr:NAD-dependent protein deacylase [Polyangiaceae bacterium]
MDPSSRDLVRDQLASARDVVFLTGAGVSAASGVPTFRGSGVVWQGKQATELANPTAFASDPMLVWSWYLHRRQVVAEARPNPAHIAIAQWQPQQEGMKWLLTQNVDDLHERAGSEDVVHVHGDLWFNRCTLCGQQREDRSQQFDEVPRSPCCDAPERPAIVWFGESLPENESRVMSSAAGFADVIVVVGSSGVVSTGPRFIARARHSRRLANKLKMFSSERQLVVVNVSLDDSLIEADVTLAGRAEEILPEILS